EAIEEMWDLLMDWFESLIEAFLELLSDLVAFVLESIGKVAEALGNLVQAVAEAGLNLVKAVSAAAMKALENLLKAALLAFIYTIFAISLLVLFPLIAVMHFLQSSFSQLIEDRSLSIDIEYEITLEPVDFLDLIVPTFNIMFISSFGVYTLSQNYFDTFEFPLLKILNDYSSTAQSGSSSIQSSSKLSSQTFNLRTSSEDSEKIEENIAFGAATALAILASFIYLDAIQSSVIQDKKVLKKTLRAALYSILAGVIFETINHLYHDPEFIQNPERRRAFIFGNLLGTILALLVIMVAGFFSGIIAILTDPNVEKVRNILKFVAYIDIIGAVFAIVSVVFSNLSFDFLSDFFAIGSIFAALIAFMGGTIALGFMEKKERDDTIAVWGLFFIFIIILLICFSPF
ncbi:MAG: hypothetical protein ACOC44_18845, partial [Promethearchaeia archaeon]